MKARKKSRSETSSTRQKRTKSPTRPSPIHAKIGRERGPRKPVYTLQQERSHRYRALSFPEVEGKKTARVELVTSDEYHAVVVVFDDNTAVGFEFQPCFTIQAFGENIGAVGGGSKNWAKIRSET
jgi:hypothetical protein